jgi:hypothetical protein
VNVPQVSLEGAIDLHVHSAPDVWPRRLDDLALARQAAEAGMRAVLLKSHHTLTADRATVVEELVEGVRVFGGLALNEAVGGLNPAAVEAALVLGARQIWMPTISAANHRRAMISHRSGPEHKRQPTLTEGISTSRIWEAFQQAADAPNGGIEILDAEGQLKPVVSQILNLMAQHDVILGTGHISVPEIQALVPAARAAGVKRILITHPELSIVNMPIAVQQELAGPGVFFERCLIATVFPGSMVPLAAIAAAVQELGPETTVLATDFGQSENQDPVDGLREYIAGMLALGINQADIERMTRVNPAWLLGL